jgi:hypothetical protein
LNLSKTRVFVLDEVIFSIYDRATFTLNDLGNLITGILLNNPDLLAEKYKISINAFSGVAILSKPGVSNPKNKSELI